MTKHKHDWKFAGWVNAPSREDDFEYASSFVRCEACDCGKKRKRISTQSEVEEHLKSITCSNCGLFNSDHQSAADCMKALFKRVSALEDRLDKLGKALS